MKETKKRKPYTVKSPRYTASRKRFSDEEIKQHQLEYRKKYNAKHRERLCRDNEIRRYPKSLQRIVDTNWSTLRKMTNRERFSWAIENKLHSSARKMISFWMAVKRCKSETPKQISSRLKEWDTLNNNRIQYKARKK